MSGNIVFPRLPCGRLHTRHIQMAVSAECSRNPPKDPSGFVVHRASEPSPPTVGALSPGSCVSTRAGFSNSRSDNSVERRDPQPVQRPISSHTRPETHQNLIHSIKEQRHPTGQHIGMTRHPGRFAQAHDQPNSEHSAIQTDVALKLASQRQQRPSFTSKRLRGARAWDFIVCKQTIVVETIGIEPMTPCLQSRCSPS